MHPNAEWKFYIIQVAVWDATQDNSSLKIQEILFVDMEIGGNLHKVYSLNT